MIRRHGEDVLFTPGPVTVPERVLAASARPLLHYGSAEFKNHMKTILEGMKLVFGTNNQVLPLCGSGRSGLEGTAATLFSPGDEALSICSGRFGLMYADILRHYGVKVTKVATDWTRDVDLDEICQALEANPRIKAVTIPHCETSTGVTHDLEAVGRIAREYDKLLLVDAVSSSGGVEMRFDEWGLDSASTGSQKGLMSPPGMGFVTLSDRAWKAAEAAINTSGCYFSLRELLEVTGSDFPGTPGTPPVTIVPAVAEAMTMILEEGLENVYQRSSKMAEAVRAGFVASGLRLFPENVKRRSPTVVVVEAPAGHTSYDLIQVLGEELGVIPATGLGSYSKKLLRFGTMGCFYQREAINMVAAVEAALVKMGVNKEAGPGVGACVASLFSS